MVYRNGKTSLAKVQEIPGVQEAQRLTKLI